MSEHAHPNYVKIWAILLGLLAVSVAGPFLGIWWVTLITAFGVALVKAYLVCANFMHLNVEVRYVNYLLVTSLVFVLLFFAGTAPDVMRYEGDNWTKTFDERELAAMAPGHQGAGDIRDEIEARTDAHGVH